MSPAKEPSLAEQLSKISDLIDDGKPGDARRLLERLPSVDRVVLAQTPDNKLDRLVSGLLATANDRSSSRTGQGNLADLNTGITMPGNIERTAERRAIETLLQAVKAVCPLPYAGLVRASNPTDLGDGSCWARISTTQQPLTYDAEVLTASRRKWGFSVGVVTSHVFMGETYVVAVEFQKGARESTAQETTYPTGLPDNFLIDLTIFKSTGEAYVFRISPSVFFSAEEADRKQQDFINIPTFDPRKIAGAIESAYRDDSRPFPPEDVVKAAERRAKLYEDRDGSSNAMSRECWSLANLPGDKLFRDALIKLPRADDVKGLLEAHLGPLLERASRGQNYHQFQYIRSDTRDAEVTGGLRGGSRRRG